MSKSGFIIAGSLVAMFGVVTELFRLDASATTPSELTLFCAASNQSVIEAIVREYRRETGRNVVVQYGASQSLLSQIEVTGEGDLFLPADDSYLEMATDNGLVTQQIPIALMHAVVAVRRGNPKHIASLADLSRADVRFVQANADAAAIGKVTRQALEQSGKWRALDQTTLAYRGTVTEAANDILVDAADAAIVYDAVLHTFPTLESVKLPELESASSRVAVGVIARSKQPTEALLFARYIAAADRGQQHYAARGFKVSPSGNWAGAAQPASSEMPRE